MKKRLFLALSIILAIVVVGCGKSEEETDTQMEIQSSTIQQKVVSSASGEAITDGQALEAVREYCFSTNPDLKDMENGEDYTLYWTVESSDESQVVVLYRSYTGALVRYYVDVNSGDTYVTEFVSGITEEEEKTGETFNVRDYLN